MSTGDDTSDERGPLERAYDEQLSEKIGEILKLAEEAGVPLFVHAGLDDGARCTSLVGVPDLSSAPIFRSLVLIRTTPVCLRPPAAFGSSSTLPLMARLTTAMLAARTAGIACRGLSAKSGAAGAST